MTTTTASVLLLDRDETGQGLLLPALESAGHRLTWTRDAVAALALVERGGLRAVLLDAELPDVDAFGVCEALGRRSPQVPVVLTGDVPSAELVVRAMRAGAADFLQRPLRPAEVLASLARVLEPSVEPAVLEPMDTVERRHIERVLAATRGNKTQAARALGFDRSTLYRKLEQYGVGTSVGTVP